MQNKLLDKACLTLPILLINSITATSIKTLFTPLKSHQEVAVF